MADRDLYAVLGVSRTASADEIKRAYRKLAKQHHPDRNKGQPSAEAKFKEVQQAYDVLSDTQKRSVYDQFGTTGPIPEGFAGGGPGGARAYRWSGGSGGQVPPDFDLSDLLSGMAGGGAASGGSIFDEFLGRRRGKRRSRESAAPPVADMEHEVTLDFEQAVRGTTLEMQLQLPGRRSANETIQVRIPPGVQDGQRIRVRGKGATAADGSRGDLFIIPRVRPHRYFRREGNDIYLDLPLTLAEATLGAKVSIPTLDGPTVVTVPPGTASGKKLRLTGRGIQDARSAERGDQYAVIRIVPPPSLSPQQRRLLDELAQTDLGHPRDELW